MTRNPHAATLLYLATHPDSTTSEIANAVFDPDGDDEMRTADRKVRYYLTEKFPHLIAADTDGKSTYSVEGEVDAGMGRIEIQSFSGDEYSVGLGGAVVYRDEEENVHVDVVGDVEFVDEK